MYDIFWKLIPGFGCSEAEKICLGSSHASSNKNQAIRAVLIFLIFFYEKISQAQKALKTQKAQKANKQISDFFPFRFFLCA